MSPRCLQVKAVLLKEGEEEGLKEIRRFRVEEEEKGDGVGLLQALLTRVWSVFNVDLPAQKCTLFWKDNDGDMIQFSTDEELTHALDVMRDDTFRLYVALSEGEGPEDPSRERLSEKHVTFHVTADPAGHVHCTNPSVTTRLACPGMAYGHGRDRKAWKAACKMGKKMEGAQNKEFHQVRQQVPEEFRRWVRQYVRLWSTQGPDAALQTFASTGEKTLPEGVPGDFPQWLHSFLTRHHAPALFSYPGPGQMEMETEEKVEGEQRAEEEGPEGLPPVYFRWLCLFLPRFRSKFGQMQAASADSEGDEKSGAQGEGQKTKCQRGQGKHGCHRGRGGRKGAQCAASSESEESDGGQKAWKKVPKEFRQYARVTVIQLHKKKGDNADNKDKAARAGLSAEVQEFVEQVLLEWHAKLTSRRPRAVAVEMMAGERSLPTGVERGHFLWLCRFLGRWHRRHAGKCDVMSGWSSGESTTDDTSGTSGEETSSAGQVLDYGPWPRHHRRELRAMMKMVRGRRPHGMMGHPPPRSCFAGMHAGPPGPFACPLPARCCHPPRCAGKRCGKMGAWAAQQDGGKRWREQDGAAQGKEASRVQDDEAVSHVTESMKKM